MSSDCTNNGALGPNSSHKDDISSVFCDPTLFTCLLLGVDGKHICRSNLSSFLLKKELRFIVYLSLLC